MQIERQWKLLHLIPDRVNRRSTDDIWNSVRSETGFEGVSKRTVERDLASLQSVFSIEQSTEGRTNYWYWGGSAGEVTMWLPGLTEDEAFAFHLVERNMRRLLPEGTVERLDPYFKVARAKLAEHPGRVRSRTQKFRLLPSGVPRVVRRVLNTEASRIVREALLNEQQIGISYWSNSEKEVVTREDGSIDLVPSEAVINPLAIIQRDSELLLVYARRERLEPEFMPLRNIESATPLKGQFDGPDNFDIDAYIESGAVHFEHDMPIRIGDWIQLSASFTKEAWNRLCNTPLVASERITTDRDGRKRLVMPLRFTADLADWLLSLGPKVIVHQPTALRRWLGAKLTAAADQYRGDKGKEEPQHTSHWYEKWDAFQLMCSNCGWTGRAHSKELEPHDSSEQTDCEFRCPTCNRLLLTVDYAASKEEIIKNWDVLDVWTRSAVLSTPERMEAFERDKLKSSDQLPGLTGRSGYPGFLTWDIVRHTSGEVSTIVKHGPRMVWIQLALWEGADEFVRVAEILAKRYARAIQDIRITPAARAFLSTDKIAGRQKIENARKLFGKSK